MKKDHPYQEQPTNDNKPTAPSDPSAFALKNPGSFDKPGQDQLYTNEPNNAAKPVPTGNTIKDPKDWTTGDEPMTGAQRSYLHTLAGEAGEQIPENMTKAEASEKIEELQHKTGRGLGEQEGTQS